MQSPRSSLPRYYLKAGELFIIDKPALVSTILGSCIAVTLFNPRHKLAGICHALLPQCMRRNSKKSIDDLLDNKCHKCHEAFKYTDCSVFMLAEIFSRLGIKPQETEARIFGGARMMTNNAVPSAKYSVGEQNIETAMMVLEHYHLKLTSSDVGGSAGRNIIFDTKDGGVAQQSVKNLYRKAGKKKA